MANNYALWFLEKQFLNEDFAAARSCTRVVLCINRVFAGISSRRSSCTRAVLYSERPPVSGISFLRGDIEKQISGLRTLTARTIQRHCMQKSTSRNGRCDIPKCNHVAWLAYCSSHIFMHLRFFVCHFFLETLTSVLSI